MLLARSSAILQPRPVHSFCASLWRQGLAANNANNQRNERESLVWVICMDFDLTPSPRVLQMLGEIDLPQWRCMAELIDNSVDGFLAAARSGTPIMEPEVAITLPKRTAPGARVSIKDNGPGMSIETLENAVRAGWSGNNPIGNLGLFGMGFNIATARLGLVTEVWTSQAGEVVETGLRIDLDDLRRSKNFRVPRQTRAKSNPAFHGTEIVISKLKPDQLQWLCRGQSVTHMRKHLGRCYSTLLNPLDGQAVFRLEMNGVRVQARRHCAWNQDRFADLPSGDRVHAIERFDVPLPARCYCVTCMATLSDGETECPTGSASCHVIEIERRVRGWVGLQRHLDDTDYGLDFIRNGRKIEMGNKELFEWRDGDAAEIEYPIDDQRKRGRFIGEIHVDHCRVSYTKDRFERDDPAWNEMVRIVRGEGPLQPIKARTLGYGANSSPLYRLFQAFRRTSPQGKAGLWSRILTVKDNARAKEMAQSFEEGNPEYITDERWWELVEEQDKEILNDSGSADNSPTSAGAGANSDGGMPPGFVGGADAAGSGVDEQAAPPPQDQAARDEPPPRYPFHELTRKFTHPVYRVEYEVQAFHVSPRDPELGPSNPWTLRLTDVATRTYGFLVNPDHDVFRSSTMTPLDALLVELSHRTVEFLRDTHEAPLALVLAEFRREYCVQSRLDPGEIIVRAQQTLMDIASSLPGAIEPGSGEFLHSALSEAERAAIARRMAARDLSSPKGAINDGLFLTYADARTIRSLVVQQPQLFIDGRGWVAEFSTWVFG